MSALVPPPLPVPVPAGRSWTFTGNCSNCEIQPLSLATRADIDAGFQSGGWPQKSESNWKQITHKNVYDCTQNMQSVSTKLHSNSELFTFYDQQQVNWNYKLPALWGNHIKNPSKSI